MSVDIQLVKQLRDATYASLKDCKTALEETNGDLEAAQQWLIKKWVSNAAKKADRELNDGQISIVSNDKRLTVFKVGCETDFVAKNDMFAQMLDEVGVILASATGTIQSINDFDPAILTKAQDAMHQYIARLGENIQVTDVFAMDLDEVKAATYMHQGNKIASVVLYRNGDDTSLATAKQIAMHIAAMNPTYMTQDQIPVEDLAAKKNEFAEELKAAGKPEAMIAQIAEGKLNKYFADLVLMNQWYIGDESKSIKDMTSGFEFVGAHRFAV